MCLKHLFWAFLDYLVVRPQRTRRQRRFGDLPLSPSLVRQLPRSDMPMIDTYCGWWFNGALVGTLPAAQCFISSDASAAAFMTSCVFRRHCRRRLFPTAPTPAQMGAQLAGVTPLPVSMICKVVLKRIVRLGMESLYGF